MVCYGYNEVTYSKYLTLCFDYQEAVEDDLDALYRGLASTLGEKEDHIMVEDLAGQELQRKYKKHIFT